MHKQRKFVLIAALIGIISMFLPWFSFFGYSINGMHGVGVLVFLCFVITGIIAYLGNQSKNLDKTMWLITLICAALATLIIGWKILYTSAGVFASFLRIGIYLAAVAAIAALVSAYLFRSPTDTIKNGFESLSNDINNKLKTTPATLDTMNTNTATNTDTGKADSGYSKETENIDNPGNMNPPL
jgi:hypothetical protein